MKETIGTIHYHLLMTYLKKKFRNKKVAQMFKKLVTISFLLFTSTTFAFQAKVTIVDSDGTLKRFIFNSKKTINIIPSELSGTLCFVQFYPKNEYIDLGCTPITEKGRFTRTATRISCLVDKVGNIVIGTAKDFEAGSEMQTMYVVASCFQDTI